MEEEQTREELPAGVESSSLTGSVKNLARGEAGREQRLADGQQLRLDLGQQWESIMQPVRRQAGRQTQCVFPSRISQLAAL